MSLLKRIEQGQGEKKEYRLRSGSIQIPVPTNHGEILRIGPKVSSAPGEITVKVTAKGFDRSNPPELIIRKTNNGSQITSNRQGSELTYLMADGNDIGQGRGGKNFPQTISFGIGNSNWVMEWKGGKYEITRLPEGASAKQQGRIVASGGAGYRGAGTSVTPMGKRTQSPGSGGDLGSRLAEKAPTNNGFGLIK